MAKTTTTKSAPATAGTVAAQPKTLADFLRARLVKVEAEAREATEKLAKATASLAALAKPEGFLPGAQALIDAKTDAEHGVQVRALFVREFPAVDSAHAGQWRNYATAAYDEAKLRRRKADAVAGVSWAAVLQLDEAPKRYAAIASPMRRIAESVVYLTRKSALENAIATAKANKAAAERLAVTLAKEVATAEKADSK